LSKRTSRRWRTKSTARLTKGRAAAACTHQRRVRSSTSKPSTTTHRASPAEDGAATHGRTSKCRLRRCSKANGGFALSEKSATSACGSKAPACRTAKQTAATAASLRLPKHRSGGSKCRATLRLLRAEGVARPKQGLKSLVHLLRRYARTRPLSSRHNELPREGQPKGPTFTPALSATRPNPSSETLIFPLLPPSTQLSLLTSADSAKASPHIPGRELFACYLDITPSVPVQIQRCPPPRRPRDSPTSPQLPSVTVLSLFSLPAQ